MKCGRWIGRRGTTKWPPRSPVLIPLDLWGRTRDGTCYKLHHCMEVVGHFQHSLVMRILVFKGNLFSFVFSENALVTFRRSMVAKTRSIL